MKNNPTASAIVEALGGSGSSARCPAHDDTTASLSVHDRDGRVLVHCHAGCAQAAVISALRDKGLWPTEPDIDLGPASGSWESWTFTTADGRERQQYRTPDGPKKWRSKGGPWPAPRDLLYLPAGELPAAPIIILTEGASDADALHAIGLAAIGRPGAKPSPESLARFDSSVVYQIFPDHDDNGAGCKQALAWHEALTAAGLDAELIDPLELRPDAPSGYDARDWCESLPVGTTPEAAGAMLNAAVVDVETIRARMPAAAAPAAPAAAPTTSQPIVVGSHSDRCSEPVVSLVLKAIAIEHRHNLRADCMEYRTVTETTWNERNDRVTAYWRQTLIPSRCLVSKQNNSEIVEIPLHFNKTEFHDALTGHAHLRSVDPFIEWIEARPTWDGVPRLDRNLIECFPSAAALGPLAEWAGRSVMLGGIIRAYHPGEKHDETLVLQGRKQGTGKSTYFAWLFPSEHRQAWFTDCFDFQRPRKEQVEALQARVLVEAADMAGSDRADVERIKQFLTSANDGSVRLAYRRDPESRPRRCIIVGTCNAGDVLPNDPTGSRRWVVISTAETAPAHRAHVQQYLDTHRDQLWAEALHRVRAGELARLPDDLKAEQEDTNAGFRAVDESGEAFVTRWIRETGQPENGPLRFEDLERHDRAAHGGFTARGDGRLSLALKSLGFERQRRRWVLGENPCMRWVRNAAVHPVHPVHPPSQQHKAHNPETWNTSRGPSSNGDARDARGARTDPAPRPALPTPTKEEAVKACCAAIAATRQRTADVWLELDGELGPPDVLRIMRDDGLTLGETAERLNLSLSTALLAVVAAQQGPPAATENASR